MFRFFIGRNAEVQSVVGFFAEGFRAVTVRGERGIGKVRQCSWVLVCGGVSTKERGAQLF